MTMSPNISPKKKIIKTKSPCNLHITYHFPIYCLTKVMYAQRSLILGLSLNGANVVPNSHVY